MAVKKEDLDTLNSWLSQNLGDSRSWKMRRGNDLNEDVYKPVIEFQNYVQSKNNDDPIPDEEFSQQLNKLLNDIIETAGLDYDRLYNSNFTDENRTATVNFATHIMQSVSSWSTDKGYDNAFGNDIRSAAEKLDGIKKATPAYDEKKSKLNRDIVENIFGLRGLGKNDSSLKDITDDLADMATDLLEQVNNTKKSNEIDTETFRDMSDKINQNIKKISVLNKNFAINPLFKELYELNRSLKEFHTMSCFEENEELMTHNLEVTGTKALLEINDHLWDEDKNRNCVAATNSIASFMKKEKFDQYTYEANNADYKEAMTRWQNLKGTNPETNRGDYFIDLNLDQKNVKALTGSGSPEYEALADALKKWKNAPDNNDNIKSLFDASRDYLKCKDSTPFTSEGKARVEAAAKVMAMAGIRLSERIASASYSPDPDSFSFYSDLTKDMMVECTRNKTFRNLMMNQCSHVIEAGQDQMYDVMQYAVQCEMRAKGKNAVNNEYAGIMAEAQKVDGKISLRENSRFHQAEKEVDSQPSIYEGEVVEAGISKREIRQKVSSLKKVIENLNAPAKTQSGPQKVKEAGGPQMGM